MIVFTSSGVRFCDSSITYRSRYLGAPEWLPVLDLVVRDDTNPRSVAYQVRGLQTMIQRIDRDLDGADLRIVPPILASLGRYADARALGADAALADWLDAVAAGAAVLSDRLSLRFFSHADDRERVVLVA